MAPSLFNNKRSSGRKRPRMTRLVSQEEEMIMTMKMKKKSNSQQQSEAAEAASSKKDHPPKAAAAAEVIARTNQNKPTTKSLSRKVSLLSSSSSEEENTSNLEQHKHKGKEVPEGKLSPPASLAKDTFGISRAKVPQLVNPLTSSARVLKRHMEALRLEADLHPMRVLLARLMQNPAHNRKGLFNVPVDSQALGLADYEQIISNPMDLGTVKNKLHSLQYTCRAQVAEDIRLVFRNAMTYNPPDNFVHKCASALLESFEESYQALPVSKLSPPPPPPPPATSSSAPAASPPSTETVAVSISLQHSENDDGAIDTLRQQQHEETQEHRRGSLMEQAADDDFMEEEDDRSKHRTASHAQVTFAPMPATDAWIDSLLPREAETGSESLQQSGNLEISSNRASKSPSSSPSVGTHSQHSTRASSTSAPAALAAPKKQRLMPFMPHACQSCMGRTCDICDQKCLLHEPALLICQGFHCAGAKIRKGAQYFISKDGSRQYCQRCYTNLGPVLPNSSPNESARYKQDLLKRTNDEEVVEEWLQCRGCKSAVHQVCAMHNSFAHSSDSYLCLACRGNDEDEEPTSAHDEAHSKNENGGYTFVSGSSLPVPLSSVLPTLEGSCTADTLKQCSISAFIESKVKEKMARVPNSGKTISVRVISDCNRYFEVPEVVRNHFRMATQTNEYVKPPSKVNYQQKAIALFQKIDGLDVCIFCMYVQEYDGNDEYDDGSEETHRSQVKPFHNKRVYIAYLDSVEYFRPRECRTEVYHEVLVSYLATARERGYHSAQIWACPPSRGNSFVFWNHPASQRTPNKEHLISWYHSVLSRAIDCGVVTDIKSLYESDFQRPLSALKSEEEGCADPAASKMICPPLLDGDFWIEEAVRIHAANVGRNLKIRPPNEVCVWNVDSPSMSGSCDPCPAMQVASLIRDRIMTHPASTPFHKPVNAAALKLVNYHKIVSKPMDLASAYSKCVLGEYAVLQDLVEDVKLMVSNAKKFNPVGHFVHTKAIEIEDLFFQELEKLTTIWRTSGSINVAGDCCSWKAFSSMSLNLDKVIDVPVTAAPQSLPKPPLSIIIPDDRSSDGSRSLASSASGAASPMSTASSNASQAGSSEVFAGAPSGGKPTAKKSKGRPPRRPSIMKGSVTKPVPKLDLFDGPEAVQQKMVGEDTWLLERRYSSSPKNALAKKTGKKRRRSSAGSSLDEAPQKKRRQSWLGEEVGDSVRAHRTSFFTCILVPNSEMTEAQTERLELYKNYSKDFDRTRDAGFKPSSQIADARSTLLEFSQYRHFEFDTLRRAKYSTSMLLYHLHNSDAPGLYPSCTTCGDVIEDIRWHKVKKPSEKRRWAKLASTQHQQSTVPEASFFKEELCACCHATHAVKSRFIPIPVTVKPSDDEGSSQKC